jgi:hypothetical protein
MPSLPASAPFFASPACVRGWVGGWVWVGGCNLLLRQHCFLHHLCVCVCVCVWCACFCVCVCVCMFLSVCVFVCTFDVGMVGGPDMVLERGESRGRGEMGRVLGRRWEEGEEATEGLRKSSSTFALTLDLSCLIFGDSLLNASAASYIYIYIYMYI